MHLYKTDYPDACEDVYGVGSSHPGTFVVLTYIFRTYQFWHILLMKYKVFTCQSYVYCILYDLGRYMNFIKKPQTMV